VRSWRIADQQTEDLMKIGGLDTGCKAYTERAEVYTQPYSTTGSWLKF